jgi:predicted acyl esterase
VFELGAHRWIDASRWPLDRPRPQSYRLGSGSGTLTWSDARSPCNAGTDQWSTGLPAYVIAEAGGSGDPCAQNDSTTQAGALSYTSPPFRTATTVAGPIDVTLHLTSTATDAEIFANVEVVHPDGSSQPISSGALLGSLRALDPRLSWRVGG